jgi:hypothetical protein
MSLARRSDGLPMMAPGPCGPMVRPSAANASVNGEPARDGVAGWGQVAAPI